MFSKKEKEKELADRELNAYKSEARLAIDRDIFERQRTNWKNLDDTRQECVAKQVAAKIESAKEEAKTEVLQEVARIKDKEIELLKELLVEAIRALQQPKDSAKK